MKKLIVLIVFMMSFSALAQLKIKFSCVIDYTSHYGNHERIIKTGKFDHINGFTAMPYALIPGFYTSDYQYKFYFLAETRKVPNSTQVKIDSRMVITRDLEEYTFYGFNKLKARIEGMTSEKKQEIDISCETVPY